MKKVILSIFSVAALSTATLFAPVQTGKLVCGRTHHLEKTRSTADFDAIIRENKKVVVDFYAEWCGPCKKLSPVIDALSKEMNDVVFLKINVDQHEGLSNKFGISGIPTLILFKDGQKVGQTGAKTKDQLKSYIQATLK